LKILVFELVNRFFGDVCIKHIYTGQKTDWKGRPKEFDGAVKLDELREDIFTTEIYD